MAKLIEDPGPILDPGGPGGKPEIVKPDPDTAFENVKIKYATIEETYEKFEEADLLGTDAGQLLAALVEQEVEGQARVMPGDNVTFDGDGGPRVFLKIGDIDGESKLAALADEGAFDNVDSFIFEPPGKDSAPEDVQIKLPLFSKVEYVKIDLAPEDGEDVGAWQDASDYGSTPIPPDDGFPDLG